MHGFLWRVSHDLGWLHRVESYIFMLWSISEVNFTPLALPEVWECAGPDIWFYNNDAVLFASVLRIGHGISHFIAISSQDPSRVIAFAGAVFCDWFQAWFVRIICEHFIYSSVSVFDFFSELVTCLVVPKNILAVVHPAFFKTHLSCGWHWDLGVSFFRLIWLNLERQLALFLSFCDSVATDWH